MLDRWRNEKVIYSLGDYIQCRGCEYLDIKNLVCILNNKPIPQEILKKEKKCLKYILIKNEAVSGIIGFAIGDALGVPIEFKSREELREFPVCTMLEGGIHGQEKGTWSDDTSLTLALIEGLRPRKYSLNSITEEMLCWYYEGKYTAGDEVFDIGNSTMNAIERIKGKFVCEEFGDTDEYSNGNGALMRILPLAYFLVKERNINEKVKKIYEITGITHAHKRAKIASHFYIEFAIQLLNNKSILESYKMVCDLIKNYYSNENEIDKFNRILSGNLMKVKKCDIKSSGYVIDTLEACIWCLLKHNDFSNTVLEAINLGFDTDTIGAVTGGLAGIYYGIESIPEKWINQLKNKELLFQEAYSLYLIYQRVQSNE